MLMSIELDFGAECLKVILGNMLSTGSGLVVLMRILQMAFMYEIVEPEQLEETLEEYLPSACGVANYVHGETKVNVISKGRVHRQPFSMDNRGINAAAKQVEILSGKLLGRSASVWEVG